MKPFSTLTLFALALLVLGGCYSRTVYVERDRDDPPPREREPDPEPVDEDPVVVEVEIIYFREPLEPWGTWVYVEGYGDCWYPDDVDDD